MIVEVCKEDFDNSDQYRSTLDDFESLGCDCN